MSEAVQGDDRHAWETEYEGLAEDLRTDPGEALPELLDLVERMLAVAGYEDGAPGAPDEPELGVVLERAREVVERSETGAEVGNDDAFQAQVSSEASTRGCSTRRRRRRAPTCGIRTATWEACDDEASVARARRAGDVLLRPAARQTATARPA